jgi:hypothetical protein
MARPYCSQCGAKNDLQGNCTNTTCPRNVPETTENTETTTKSE